MLHLTVNPNGPFWPKEAVEAQLDQAQDWIRYATNSWLLWTDKSAEEWHHIFRDNVPELRQHQYLIVGADISERQGWMPQQVWEWVNRYSDLYRQALLDLLSQSSTPTIKKRRLSDPGAPNFESGSIGDLLRLTKKKPEIK